MPTAALTNVEEIAHLLDIVDAERPPATPEEVDGIVRNERDKWAGIDKDALLESTA